VNVFGGSRQPFPIKAVIVTESFVWINYPKSGSTFVRRVLRELYKSYARAEKRGNTGFRLFRKRRPERFFEELRVPELRIRQDAGRAGAPTPHGTVSQIPEGFRHLPLVSSVREPVDRLKSAFIYGDWKREDVLFAPIEVLRARYPAFPGLSFFEFVEMAFVFNAFELHVGTKVHRIGPLSADLLKFYLRRPLGLSGDAAFSSWADLESELAPVTFLRQDHLSDDLADALVRFGHRREDVDFIRQKPKANTARAQVEVGSDEIDRVRAFVSAEDPLLAPLLRRLLGDDDVSLGSAFSPAGTPGIPVS
jgi:hypothetical protein